MPPFTTGVCATQSLVSFYSLFRCPYATQKAGQGQSLSTLLPCYLLPSWALSQVIALGSSLETSDGGIITDHMKAID